MLPPAIPDEAFQLAGGRGPDVVKTMGAVEQVEFA
jgi:hypothetical protein